jgi:hypothetical protein
MKNSKTWTRSDIDALLVSNSRAVERAMVVLYDLQTQDEKVTAGARHLNGRGFSANAARKGTYYARWVLGGRHLTGHHLDRAQAIALRHSRQLVEAANARTAEA